MLIRTAPLGLLIDLRRDRRKADKNLVASLKKDFVRKAPLLQQKAELARELFF